MFKIIRANGMCEQKTEKNHNKFYVISQEVKEWQTSNERWEENMRL